MSFKARLFFHPWLCNGRKGSRVGKRPRGGALLLPALRRTQAAHEPSPLSLLTSAPSSSPFLFFSWDRLCPTWGVGCEGESRGVGTPLGSPRATMPRGLSRIWPPPSPASPCACCTGDLGEGWQQCPCVSPTLIPAPSGQTQCLKHGDLWGAPTAHPPALLHRHLEPEIRVLSALPPMGGLGRMHGCCERDSSGYAIFSLTIQNLNSQHRRMWPCLLLRSLSPWLLHVPQPLVAIPGTKPAPARGSPCGTASACL